MEDYCPFMTEYSLEKCAIVEKQSRDTPPQRGFRFGSAELTTSTICGQSVTPNWFGCGPSVARDGCTEVSRLNEINLHGDGRVTSDSKFSSGSAAQPVAM
jgi:hypothetical protein